jgi:hypothetical protein
VYTAKVRFSLQVLLLFYVLTFNDLVSVAGTTCTVAAYPASLIASARPQHLYRKAQQQPVNSILLFDCAKFNSFMTKKIFGVLLPRLLRLLVNVAAAHIDMQLLEQVDDGFSSVLDIRPSRVQLAIMAPSNTVGIFVWC